MRNIIDPRIHIGEEYGIFRIDDVLPIKDKYGHWIYKAVCKECGYEKFSHYGRIKNPMTTTCDHTDQNNQYKCYVDWKNHRIGHIFTGMKSRCYSDGDSSYNRYGARGIKICDEWLNNPKSFEDWSLSNGYADNLTIDRIDENKDYCPENCRWIPKELNAKYKSTTRMLNVDGVSHTGREWASILNISTNLINNYVRQYGEENTVEFIRRVLKNPSKLNDGTSYYKLYMMEGYPSG